MIIQQLEDMVAAWFSYRCCADLANFGLINDLKQILKRGCLICKKECCNNAKWPYSRNIIERITRNAAFNGQIETVKWAIRLGGASTTACIAAARGGHPNIIELAIQDGGDSSNVYIGAIYGGRLDIVKWAKNNYMPGQKYACMAAVDADKAEILEWLFQNNYRLNIRPDSFISQNIAPLILEYPHLVSRGDYSISNYTARKNMCNQFEPSVKI